MVGRLRPLCGCVGSDPRQFIGEGERSPSRSKSWEGCPLPAFRGRREPLLFPGGGIYPSRTREGGLYLPTSAGGKKIPSMTGVGRPTSKGIDPRLKGDGRGGKGNEEWDPRSGDRRKTNT